MIFRKRVGDGETGETEGQSPCPKDTGTVPLSPLSPAFFSFVLFFQKSLQFQHIVTQLGCLFEIQFQGSLIHLLADLRNQSL